MLRTLTMLLALSTTACLEVSTDPHLPGGSIPLPKQSIGPVGAKLDLDDLQAQLARDPSSPALPNEVNEPLAPTDVLDPVAPSTPEIEEPDAPRFVALQQDWEAKGCSAVGLCHDLDERTIVVKMNPDAARLLLNWEQIAPPEAGGVGVAAAGSVAHFAGGDSAALWQSWQDAGYPFVE
jgi:hypothetical protein